MELLSFEVLKSGDATTTNAIISAFQEQATFVSFANAETEGILARDAEDAEKLAEGIRHAVSTGVLPADPPVEPTNSIDVLGKSVDDVTALITQALGDAPTAGCIFVLSGLSGTGKGTTVAKLQQALPRAMAWSNGNVFRSITLLVLEHCASTGTEFSETVLTPELLESCFAKLTFGKSDDGTFDTMIHLSESETLRVSEVQNTKLKEPRIGKSIPTVAKMTQGGVVKFAAGAAEAMRADGMNVLIEGRSQTLDYIRTPHRFELTLSNPAVIGQRRAAQRMMGEALSSLGSPEEPPTDSLVHAALQAALGKMGPAVAVPPAAQPPPAAPPADSSLAGAPKFASLAERRQVLASYVAEHQVESGLGLGSPSTRWSQGQGWDRQAPGGVRVGVGIAKHQVESGSGSGSPSTRWSQGWGWDRQAPGGVRVRVGIAKHQVESGSGLGSPSTRWSQG